MKFSDKALRLIGRKLLERTDCNTLQDDMDKARNRDFRASRVRHRARKATVLNFTKRLR